MSTAACAPEGFLLLTLPNCTLTTPSDGAQTGYLALQCVTLGISSDYQTDRDVWLVLKLNSFEMIISPTQRINYSRSMHTYIFLPEFEGSGIVQLFVPPDSSNPASSQDLETMEVILSQYGVLCDFEAERSVHHEKTFIAENDNRPGILTGTTGFKGRLVLMDENDGEIVGTLDEAVLIKEDNALAAEGHEKDPVVINLPGEATEREGGIEAYAHLASPEEQDMLMRTAGLISRGITLATSVIANGINSASNYYITHSKPSRHVEFSPRMRTNMRRIHKVSGTAVTVTSKTTGAILKTLHSVANRVSGSAIPGNRLAARSRLPPPLPPRVSSSVHPPSWTPPAGAPPFPPRKPRILNRVLASTDLLVTTLEQSARVLTETSTNAVSASLAHKYGQHIGDASSMADQSVQNVGLVYIDSRGVGRRALLKKGGKTVVNARMGGRDILLGTQGQAMQPAGVNIDYGQYPSAPLSGAPLAQSNSSKERAPPNVSGYKE